MKLNKFETSEIYKMVFSSENGKRDSQREKYQRKYNRMSKTWIMKNGEWPDFNGKSKINVDFCTW